MENDKSTKDIITEEEYTAHMLTVPTDPEEDSPADSESDSSLEFSFGLDYMPDEQDETDEEVDDLAEAPMKEPIHKPIVTVAETAQVISSDQPSPWMDRDSPSSTH